MASKQFLVQKENEMSHGLNGVDLTEVLQKIRGWHAEIVLPDGRIQHGGVVIASFDQSGWLCLRFKRLRTMLENGWEKSKCRVRRFKRFGFFKEKVGYFLLTASGLKITFFPSREAGRSDHDWNSKGGRVKSLDIGDFTLYSEVEFNQGPDLFWGEIDSVLIESGILRITFAQYRKKLVGRAWEDLKVKIRCFVLNNFTPHETKTSLTLVPKTKPHRGRQKPLIIQPTITFFLPKFSR